MTFKFKIIFRLTILFSFNQSLAQTTTKNNEKVFCDCYWFWDNPNKPISVDSLHYKNVVYYTDGKLKKEEIYNIDSSMVSGTCFTQNGNKCKEIIWSNKRRKYTEVSYDSNGKKLSIKKFALKMKE